jgi:hypothetical protein
MLEEHDPTLEPWASMPRDELLERLARAEDPAEVEFLNEFLMDKLSIKELVVVNHAHAIAAYLIREYDAYGNAQCVYLTERAGALAAEIMRGMPPRGTPQECN